MAIPEVFQFVFQSGAIVNNEKLFVVYMGQPIKIMNLAENMIRLSGVQEIDIIETGLRPGKKLYEELLIKKEELDRTSNGMIFVERDTELSVEKINHKLKVFKEACDTGDNLLAKEALRRVVPTFGGSEEVNNKVV